MQTYFICLSTIMLLAISGSSLSARLITVSSANALEDAIENALPGDTIQVADGVYDTNGSLTMTRSGTEQNPILIRAANIGMAELTGDSYFDFRQCAYVIVEGFLFTATDNTVIKLQACNNVRITRNIFRLHETESLKWVIIQGIWNDPNAMSHHNRIDHNLFENKRFPGNCITIDGTPDPTYLSSQNDRIDHNHFRNVGPRVQNEMETIRIGWSEMSMSSGFTVVEYNLFEDCDGDPEIISVKTCDDTIRYNTFRRSQGTLSLRHGNRSVVEGNFFFGEGKPGTGGIRLYGDDHQIVNNYFEGLTGTRWDAPLTLTNGDYDGGGSLSRHFRINRALIAHNTLVDNDHHIEIGFTNNGNYDKPPRDVIMTNNLVWGRQNQLVQIISNPINMQWAGNLMFPENNATLGIPANPSEIWVTDPQLMRTDSLMKLSSASPAIDSAAGTFWLAAEDLDGQQRDALPDIGADEFSSLPVLRQPLTAQQVGPFADDLMTALNDRRESGIPLSPELFQNYPNPFNPTTDIRYQISIIRTINLTVFDNLGRKIRTLVNELQPAGSYTASWDGRDDTGVPVSSGIYLYLLRAGEFVQSRKMILVR